MKIKFHVFLGLMLFFSFQLSAKIRFLTFHCNKPEFIELQYKTFKKFILDDHELIVFNDAKTPELEKEIKETCEKYDIPCIRYEQKWHEIDPLNDQIATWLNDPKITHPFISTDPIYIMNQPSVRHCHVIKYALDHFGYNHDDIVGLVDGDAFPIRPISVKSLLDGCQMAGLRKFGAWDNLDYLWVVFVVFDMRALPNKKTLKFAMDVIDNVIHDTGSDVYNYLRNNPVVRSKTIPGYSSRDFANWTDESLAQYGFNNKEIAFIRNLPWPLGVEIHLEKHILHFANSSWDHPGHEEKTEHVRNFINAILQD